MAHLAGSAEVYTDVISRSVQGDASPPAGRQASGPANAASAAAGNAQRVLARREKSWETRCSPTSSLRTPS